MTALNGYLRSVVSAVLGFSRVSVVAFVVGCAALAVSRVCQLAAFFLPLKIFIIIHSGEVPSYFDIFPQSMEQNDILLLLCVLVPVIYGAFIGLGIVYRWLIDFHIMRFGKNELLISGKKIPNNHVKKAHNHVSKAFSEAGLIGVSVAFALVLDPMVAVSWLLLLYLNLWLFHAYAFDAADHDRLTFLKLHRRQFIDYVSSANFLLVFAVLAIELIYFDMGVYAAIFLLLVSRMVFQALNRFSVESLYIIKLIP
ncbi:hypothetical protein DHB74_00300 [Pseudomonas sp. G11-1]|nr:hypothetical protein [Pseudomonas sp. G11-1]MCO5789106.1 hypothetical protein [Pseudomonas sp. G11-2]